MEYDPAEVQRIARELVQRATLFLEAQLALCQVQIEAHAREALRAQPQLSPAE